MLLVYPLEEGIAARQSVGNDHLESSHCFDLLYAHH
jgi:hypothetical protein